MDEAFKEYLQEFLRRYDIEFYHINFDIVSDSDSLWKQLKTQSTPPDIDLKCALNLIFDLYNEGIYLYSPGYKLEGAYLEQKDKWIDDEKKGRFSTENYIERFLLDDTVKQAVYKNESKYAMGNPYRLSPKECTLRGVAKAIAERYYSNAECTKIIIDAFIKSFYAKHGICDRLKRDLGFDIDMFNKEQYGAEIYKIIYFIYEMENIKIPELLGQTRFELPEFIKKSSMESVDISIFDEQEDYGRETYNGKITRLIKNIIEKELDLKVRDKIFKAHRIVSEDWEELLCAVLNKMQERKIAGKPPLKIEKVNKLLQQISDELSKISKSPEKPQASPIETLYFLRFQYEYLGGINDCMKIIDMPIEAEYDIPPKLMENMIQLNAEKVPFDQVEDYIYQHADLLVDYVYYKKTLNANERKNCRRKIRNCREQISRFIQYSIDRRPDKNVNDEITKLYIVSCLQAILTDNNNLNFKYNAYKLGNHKPYRIKGALRENDTTLLDSCHVYWERKIELHQFANLGQYEIRKEFTDFQKLCYTVMSKIYSAKSIEEMLAIHWSYYDNLKCGLGLS